LRRRRRRTPETEEQTVNNDDSVAKLSLTRRSVLWFAGAGAGAVLSAGVADRAAALTRPGADAPSVGGSWGRPRQVGAFLIWLGPVPTSRPRIRIAHDTEPNRILWESPAVGGFLAGGSAQTHIEENDTPASGFTISDVDLVRYDRQTISSAVARGGTLAINGTLSGPGLSVGYTMTWTAAGDDQLRFSVTVSGPGSDTVNRLFVRYASNADERFFGFGQQMTFSDQKGRLLPILVQEHGVGRGMPILTELVASQLGPRSAGNWATTEVSVPQYITNQCRSLFLETTEYCVFDLRYPDHVEIEIFAGAAAGQVLHGSTPLDLIEAYTAYAGRMRELPDWVHEGAIICSEGGTDAAQQLIGELADAGVPVAAFWFQDWTGQNPTDVGVQVWWNWVRDDALYHDFDGLRDTLTSRLGARIMLYVNPFLTTQAGHDDLYQEAAAHGYLVKNAAGDPYPIPNSSFTAGLIDLSNPDACTWIKGIIEEQMITGSGASGWMADFGEALPFDAVLASGESPDQWHNRYPEEWARINREAIQETGHDADGLFFNRSGYTRSPGISTLFWVGDQLQNWDIYNGLASAITAAVSGGISGFSLVHSDTGGFDSITLPVPNTTTSATLLVRTPELLLRWSEFSAFTPVMRTHEGINPPVTPQIDADPATLAAFARCVHMYRAWAPYRRQLVSEAAATGHPIMRHLILHYPDDPIVVGQLPAEYLLGSDILVSPVTTASADTVSVYFPAGTWTHIWTHQTYGGATGVWQDVPAPLGQPPVFIRDGAPLQAAFDALATA
jgi:alpha-glucosidase